MRLADVDAETCRLLGGLVNPVRFTAYGRSYGIDEDAADSLLSPHETYVPIVRSVAVCERCRQFHELVVGIKVAPSDNDLWVVNEHKYGVPIPLDIAPGQTLTQFELDSDTSQ